MGNAFPKIFTISAQCTTLLDFVQKHAKMRAHFIADNVFQSTEHLHSVRRRENLRAHFPTEILIENDEACMAGDRVNLCEDM